MSDFAKLKKEFNDKIFKAKSSKEVETIRLEVFGKNGFINSEFKKLASISPEDKKKFASEINHAKQELVELFNNKSTELLENEIDERVKKEKEDVTLPEKNFKIGKNYPSPIVDLKETRDRALSAFKTIN